MGSGHTHRNRRGKGRKNTGGQPRPNGAAGQSNQGAVSGRGASGSAPEFLPHASQLTPSEPVRPAEEEPDAVELISMEEREAFVVFASSSDDALDETVETEDEVLVVEDSDLIEESEGEAWAQAGEMEAEKDEDVAGAIEARSAQPPAEPPSPPPARGHAPRLPRIPFARPDSPARREWRAQQPGEAHEERSMPGERSGGQNGLHAHAAPNGHEAHGFNGHRTPPRGNGHAEAANGERAERWPGADRWASVERDELILRPDIRGDVGPLIDELRAVFQRDRAVASGMGATRCGICYLHFPLDELEYREAEGFYVCPVCGRALGTQRLPMVRRQKRM